MCGKSDKSLPARFQHDVKDMLQRCKAVVCMVQIVETTTSKVAGWYVNKSATWKSTWTPILEEISRARWIAMGLKSIAVTENA